MAGGVGHPPIAGRAEIHVEFLFVVLLSPQRHGQDCTEAMFLWYVSDYETWPLAKDSRVIEGLMIAPAGQQCWAAQYTS